MPQSKDNDLTSKFKESDMAGSKCNLVYTYYLLAMRAGCVVRHNRPQTLAQQEECFLYAPAAVGDVRATACWVADVAAQDVVLL